MVWSLEAADDLRNLWGPPGPQLPSNALDILYDSLIDPNYNPTADEPYKGLYRWADGRLATPEETKVARAPGEALVAAMAGEIKAEIDREVAAATSSVLYNPSVFSGKPPAAKLPVWLRNTIELTPAGRGIKDAAIQIWTEGLVRPEPVIEDHSKDPSDQCTADE